MNEDTPVNPHPTEKMLARLLFTLDNGQLVLFAHLVGCESCRKILAEMPLETFEGYGPQEVRPDSPIPAELLSFPLDEEGRPQPPRSRRGGAIRRGGRYQLPVRSKD